jgi:hypothetical protein
MSVAAGGAVRSLIPARIDRLPWSPFHTRMVAALGVAWILDGLEISVASAVGDTLTHPETLGLSSTQVGLIATVYRCRTGWADGTSSRSRWPSTSSAAG